MHVAIYEFGKSTDASLARLDLTRWPGRAEAAETHPPVTKQKEAALQGRARPVLRSEHKGKESVGVVRGEDRTRKALEGQPRTPALPARYHCLLSVTPMVRGSPMVVAGMPEVLTA